MLIEKLTSTYGRSKWKLVFHQIPPEFSFTIDGLEYPGLPRLHQKGGQHVQTDKGES